MQGWNKAKGDTIQVLKPKAKGLGFGVHTSEAKPIWDSQEPAREGSPPNNHHTTWWIHHSYSVLSEATTSILWLNKEGWYRKVCTNLILCPGATSHSLIDDIIWSSNFLHGRVVVVDIFFIFLFWRSGCYPPSSIVNTHVI